MMRVLEYINTFKPDVVGLSAVVSTCYAQVKRLSELIKNTRPETKLVLGEILTASANLVLRKTKVDICVIGDGEIAWVDLLHYIDTNRGAWDFDDLKKITGLAFIDDKEINFHRLWEKNG